MTTRPRVLIVHNRYLQDGGEDVVVDAEAELLSSNGHDVCRLNTSNAELADFMPVRAAAETVWSARSRTRVADAHDRFKPDVIHFHNTFPLLSPAVYYSPPRHVPVVQTLHNYRLVCPAATLMRAGKPCEDCVGHFAWSGIRHACYRSSRGATLATAAMVQTHRVLGTWSRRIDAYIALTAFARDIFIRGGLPAAKVHVKPNFVDPDPGLGVARDEHFLFVGRFEEGKGVRVLLEAWSRLKSAPPLRLIGSGPLEPEVAHFASTCPAVEMPGRLTRTQVIAELKKARGLIAPMLWYENFPLSICEAMATGCPVIASDIGNIRDLLGNGTAGLLFKAGDAAELARTMERVLTDDASVRASAVTARKLFEKAYTAAVNYGMLAGIYEHAVRAKAMTA